MNEEEIRRAILDTPFAGDVEALMAGGQPALRLHTESIPLDDLAMGASRLGGVPDLPPDMSWPCNGDWPLELIALTDLSWLDVGRWRAALFLDPPPASGSLRFQ